MKLNSIKQCYLDQGYYLFERDDSIINWLKNALEPARNALKSNDNSHWYRYQNSWFVGVNVLDNSPMGAFNSGRPLSGEAVSFIEQELQDHKINLDKGQLSVCFPNYPQAADDEPESSHRYRLLRDAAHIDGIIRENGERYLVEYHDYILAIPMNNFSVDAAPFVVWPGSHHIIKKGLNQAMMSLDSSQMRTSSVTEAYGNARSEVFENCSRREINFEPGQVLLAHRHLLHGTGTWKLGAQAEDNRRMICFFRPESMSINEWLLND